MEYPDQAARYELCWTGGVTLDGRPAKISGARRDFATVTALPDGPGYEWPWPTVARIVARGASFSS
jgi:hypothetical protein